MSSRPAFQLADHAYQSAPISEPLVGVFMVALDRNRLLLPTALRTALQRSAVQHLGLFVNVDHLEIVGLKRIGADARQSRFFVGLVRDEIVAAIKVADLTERGRVGIPAGFSQASRLDQVALAIGMADRIEVWNANVYFAKRHRREKASLHPLQCGTFGSFVPPTSVG